MSRLVCLDYREGRRVDVQGTEYRVTRLSRSAGRIKLEPIEAEKGRAMVLTSDQLATMLVTEDAVLVDELDDPEPDDAEPRKVTDVSLMELHRVIDWMVKIFLLRQLIPFIGASPNSRLFRRAYDDAQALLKLWLDSAGVTNVPSQTCWTTYQDLLKWRRKRYSLAAVQVKGLQYTPWRPRDPFYALAEELARKAKLENPSWSTANVYRYVNSQLSNLGAEDEQQ
jgi:hypothetical protein